MSRPFQENLEIAETKSGAWIQCSRCGHRLSGADGDWRARCVVKQLPPSSMGPHRELMEGRMMLEEIYCPNCGVTFDASVVETEPDAQEISFASGRPARRKGKKSTAPQPVTLNPATTTVIALDLHIKACDPSHVGHELVKTVPGFLDRARAAAVPVIFIVPAWDKGKPEDRIAEPMKRQSNEPVLYPHAYDKFASGEMLPLLQEWGTETIIFLGGSANFSMLYTGSTAARVHGFSVVVPLDGIYAHSDYEMEYALYQLTVIPRMHDKFSFTTLDGISFR
ncbi:MAG: isochorismatase family protein [Alphaproteobacteria bacterium]|nr:isochorismatase family protein [Alphaproteobacteria bacterium]